MALLRKPKQRNAFSLQNDPKNPSVIWWRYASKEEWDDHQIASANVAYNPREKKMVISPEKIREQRAINIAFAFSLVVAVDHLEIEGGVGAPVSVTWPEDADKVAKYLGEDVALIEIFVKRVMSAHQPDSAAELSDRDEDGGERKNSAAKLG